MFGPSVFQINSLYQILSLAMHAFFQCPFTPLVLRRDNVGSLTCCSRFKLSIKTPSARSSGVPARHRATFVVRPSSCHPEIETVS
jgi:hypothetical protein